MRTIAITFIFFTIVNCAFAQSKKELKQQQRTVEFEAIRPLLESQEFLFTAEYVNSSLIGTKSLLSHPNTLELRNDSVFCDLPFFGTAYHVEYGERGGLQFEQPLTQWKLKDNKKKSSYTITFESKKTNDWYRFTLMVFGEGNSTLTVTSQNRQSISYWGKVDSKEEKK